MMTAFSAASWLPRARRPHSQMHPQRFFRPQINTDWHRLRAKALSESPGNHRYRLTSVYQPERVTQGTCPCDTFPNLVKCKKQLLTTLRLLFLHYSNTFITFAPKKIQYNDKQRRSTAFSWSVQYQNEGLWHHLPRWSREEQADTWSFVLSF